MTQDEQEKLGKALDRVYRKLDAELSRKYWTLTERELLAIDRKMSDIDDLIYALDFGSLTEEQKRRALKYCEMYGDND